MRVVSARGRLQLTNAGRLPLLHASLKGWEIRVHQVLLGDKHVNVVSALVEWGWACGGAFEWACGGGCGGGRGKGGAPTHHRGQSVLSAFPGNTSVRTCPYRCSGRAHLLQSACSRWRLGGGMASPARAQIPAQSVLHIGRLQKDPGGGGEGHKGRGQRVVSDGRGHKCTRRKQKKHSLRLPTQCCVPSEGRAQCSVFEKGGGRS